MNGQLRQLPKGPVWCQLKGYHFAKATDTLAKLTAVCVCVCAESRVHLFSFYKSYKRKKKERRQLYKSIKPAPARGQGESISTNYCFVPGRFRHAAWQTDSTQNAQNRRQMWPHNAVGLMSLAFCSKEASTGRVITLNRLTTLTDRGPQKKKKLV